MKVRKPRICPKALEQMRHRVENRPWAEVKIEEDGLWGTKSDCPSLGLASSIPPKKPIRKEVGEKLPGPMDEARLH